MAAAELKPRWGQPLTGIISFVCFLGIALFLWFIFSDPRGPVKSFPYPFVMYLAMMILVGVVWHLSLGDWPFQNLKQPARGVVQTILAVFVSWFMVHIVFYKLFGLGFNFMSQDNLNVLAAAGQAGTLDFATMKANHFAESAVVCFVLMGFFTYPFATILFAKWPVRPSDLPQPQAGLLEIAWCSFWTMIAYVVLIVPFWGLVFGTSCGSSFGLNTPWWGGIAGFNHLHWVFGWWEWSIVILFMTANVWRMKPWTLIKLAQPMKGLISVVIIMVASYAIALLCVKTAPLWLPQDVIHHLQQAKPNDAELLRFLWYHSAEIAGFSLIFFLAWHHFFDDMGPMEDKDSWAGFWFRTVGIIVLSAISYIVFYYLGWGEWALGNPHWEHKFVYGESLVWNFWWIIPLLYNDWFFHKWPFYVHE